MLHRKGPPRAKSCGITKRPKWKPGGAAGLLLRAAAIHCACWRRQWPNASRRSILLSEFAADRVDLCDPAGAPEGSPDGVKDWFAAQRYQRSPIGLSAENLRLRRAARAREALLVLIPHVQGKLAPFGTGAAHLSSLNGVITDFVVSGPARISEPRRLCSALIRRASILSIKPVSQTWRPEPV